MLSLIALWLPLTLILLLALGAAVSRPFGPPRRDKWLVRSIIVLLVMVAPLPLWLGVFWAVKVSLEADRVGSFVRELRAELASAPYNFRSIGHFTFVAPLERYFPQGTTREVAMRVLQTDNGFECRSTSDPLLCEKRVPGGAICSEHWRITLGIDQAGNVFSRSGHLYRYCLWGLTRPGRAQSQESNKTRFRPEIRPLATPVARAELIRRAMLTRGEIHDAVLTSHVVTEPEVGKKCAAVPGAMGSRRQVLPRLISAAAGAAQRLFSQTKFALSTFSELSSSGRSDNHRSPHAEHRCARRRLVD
jgi:hypothetical protein